METSYGNPKTEVMIDKNCRNRSQTIDFSKKRHLSRLHNSNSNSKNELV